MDRRLLEYFLAVVDAGSMSRAADALRVSQPAVSHAIRTLERQLGAPLFDRRGGQLIITQTGTSLVGPARRVIREFLAAERAIARVVQIDVGQLDLAIPQILALYPGADLLARFTTEHPNVRIRVEDEIAADAAWEAVASGRCEVGLVTSVADSDLKAHLLGRHRLVAVLPPGSAHDGVPMTLAEIAATRWVCGPPLGFASRVAVERAMAAEGLHVSSKIVTAHRQVIPRLILSGAAPGLLISEEAADLQAFGAVLRPTEPVFERPFYLVHGRARLSAAAQAFVELALRPRRRDPRAGGSPLRALPAHRTISPADTA